MTPRVTAAIALRIIAFVLVLWVVSDLATVVWLFLRSHSAAHASNPTIAPSFDRTHAAPPALAFLWSALPLGLTRLTGGFLLFWLSKPLGKFIAHGLE